MSDKTCGLVCTVNTDYRVQTEIAYNSLNGSLPFFFSLSYITSVISTSLLSKLLSYERQGMGTSALQNMASVANIIGPLWAGALLWTNLYVLMGIEIFLFFLLLAMFGGSWKRLKPDA